VPAGYQILQKPIRRSRSLTPERRFHFCQKRSHSCEERFFSKKCDVTTDKFNRKKLLWPRSGRLCVELYPSRAVKSVDLLHTNHLEKQIRIEKQLKFVHNLVLIADGGPDWSVKGAINFLSMGLLWRDLRLDTLVVQCYAPGHSRFNPIERTWAFLTNRIATVTLPDIIDGIKPAVTDESGWLKVLDEAVDISAAFWNDKYYSGFPITVNSLKSDDEILPVIKRKHENHKTFIDAPKKLLKTARFSKLLEDYTFLVKHANRKAYQLEFIRCEDSSCNHCSELPVRKNQFLKLISDFGKTCPVPTPSDTLKGHYKTLLELLRVRSKKKPSLYNPTAFGSCEKGCSYLFFSEADKRRHMRLMKH